MRAAGIGLLASLALACQERLALPSQCPDLCPGQGLIVRDTVLLAITGRDSTYTGYISSNEVTALLVSNGLPAGDARSWAIFQARPDSIFVVGVRYAYTIDSAAIQLHLTARDTAVKDVYLVLHRIPLGPDSTSTLEDIDQHLVPETVVDSILVPDTAGTFRMVLEPELVGRLDPDETDTTRFAVGWRLSAPEPTGVRLGSNFSLEGGPLYLAYVQVPSTDTTLRRQTIAIPADTANYVIEVPPPDPELLGLGGKSGSRSLIRFDLPRSIKDSATILRATLELTAPGPLAGLPNDIADLRVRAVLVDVGAKSPAFSGAFGRRELETGASGVIAVEVVGPVGTWIGPAGLPPSLLVGVAPEGGTFTRPEFFSTRAPDGAPRIRITYAVAARPGFP